VVLYTNPRGFHGYGEEFGNIIHTKYPGDDFTDLMKGVDAMIAKGYIDPKKLCVTGAAAALVNGLDHRPTRTVSPRPYRNIRDQLDHASGHGRWRLLACSAVDEVHAMGQSAAVHGSLADILRQEFQNSKPWC